MKKSARLLNAVIATFLSTSVFSIAAAAEGTLNDGIYTAEQAAAGKPLFEQNCSACHNADFYKTTLNSYNGQPVLYMFESIMAGMPADKPGVLMDNEYEDIVAHIFMLLGFPAGEQRLAYAGDVMKNTKVVRAP
jgi:mono/diheme cytochrome c family protein